LKLLLDTHVLLWILSGDKRIKKIEKRLLSPDDDVFFSVVSLWEIAIKSSAGKIDAQADAVRSAALASRYEELPVFAPHAVHVAKLPWYHRDPFDRLLVAQAMTEPMRLLTADADLLAYGPSVELV
jgi:PIN domain nuclease of toxin-antitoxin system